jgi:hypothetical protein
MGKSKLQTRFVVTIGGVPHKLFSVREVKDGTLVLMLPHDEKIGQPRFDGTMSPPPPGGLFKEVRDHHWSVHPSSDSLGFTFKQTVEFSDGSKTGVASFITPTPDGLLFPLFGHMTPNLANETLIYRPSQKDCVVFVASYNPRVETLVYFVVVADKASADRMQAIGPLGLCRADFTHFSLVVLYTFMAAVSMPSGYYVTGSTSTLKGGPEKRIEGAVSATPSQVLSFIHNALGRMHRAFLGYFIAWTQENNQPVSRFLLDNIAFMAAHYSRFSREQIKERRSH